MCTEFTAGQAHALVPLLAQPFGRVVKVVAQVAFHPGDPRAKADPGGWQVRVESVGGQALPAPVSLALEAGWSAPDGALPTAPGRYVLMGYETVRAGGQPEGLRQHPELRDFPLSADVAFHLDRVFAVLKTVAPAP